MKINATVVAKLLCLAAVTFNLHLESAHAQGTAFTYQGHLNDDGSPANGGYDLQFAIYDANTNGEQVGPVLTNAATPVSNGLFAVTLDFGALFNGTNYWLQIAVRTNGGAAFTTLNPRQQLTSAPYAIFAFMSSNLLGTLAATQLSGTLAATQLPATIVTNGASGLSLSGTFSGNGAALTSLNASQLVGGTVPESVLSPDVAKNIDAYSVSWSTYVSPYSSTNSFNLNAINSLVSNSNPIHWLTSPTVSYLVSGTIPAVTGYGIYGQTPVIGCEFGLNGNQITVNLGGNGGKFNVQVDGGVPQTFQVPSNQGGQYYFTMTFNTYTNRLIRFEGSLEIIDFEGFPTNSIVKRPVAAKKILIVGDSFSGGANGVAPEDTFAYDYLKFHPKADVWVDAVGGTGYVSTNGLSQNFIQRFPLYVLPNQFDAIIVAGGYNDGGWPSNVLYAAASLYYQTIRSNYPNSFLGVVLPFNSLTPLPAGTSNAIYAIRAACRDNCVPFIDPSGSSTNDAPGANPWIYGYYLYSGNAGGNAQIYIGSDGTHPTLAGHLFLEANLDEWITSNSFAVPNQSNIHGGGSGLTISNAAGAKFSLMVNPATNGFIFISQ